MHALAKNDPAMLSIVFYNMDQHMDRMSQAQ